MMNLLKFWDRLIGRTEDMKEKIIILLNQNFSYNKIAKLLGCSKATISYHAKKIGRQKFNKKKYDWVEIQNFYNEGNSYRKCAEKFNINSTAWDKAVKNGLLVVNNKPKEIHEIKGRFNLKKRILRLSLLKYECSECSLPPKWNGKVLSLQLDHINGVNNDNRIENLRFLCPNCHSQTETFAHKNRKNYKKSEID